MTFVLPPTGLPVEDCIDELRVALASSGQAVLEAPPGAGKTTVVPLRLLDEPWLSGQRIVMLEPRRVATRAAARRMASSIGEPVGGTIGYRTRDERRTTSTTRIEVVTEGMLTRWLQRDPSLPGIGLVVFDEVHERNLQTDLAMALVLDARPAWRPDLRLLAMSATIDTNRLAGLLTGGSGGSVTPIVSSAGRSHPVDVRWVPRSSRDRLEVAVANAVRRAIRDDQGDVLVFLPGAAEIRRAERALSGDALPSGVDVHPLYGALSAEVQDRALTPSPPGRRRVVLASDIAESSLTVEGVAIVVDAGLARSPRYDPRSGLTRLHTGPASRASGDQRAGRAGRTGPGVVYRLWSKLEQATRPAFAPPEMATVDLAGLALELAVWGSGEQQLSFLDPPPPAALAEGRALLRELGALDSDGRPTTAGRAMVDLPVHPRLGAMVVASVGGVNGRLACVLAAMLEERDVLRGRPGEVTVDIAERVRVIADPGADHPQADRRAVTAVRHRADELARRAGVRGHAGAVDLSACGAVLARAYPDRIGQTRGNGRFRLRSGGGAWVPLTDPLAAEPFVVVADLEAGGGERRDHRVRMAAGLDAVQVEEAAGDAIERFDSLGWDAGRDDLRRRTERRLGALVLGSEESPAPPGPATVRALLDRVRAAGLDGLRGRGTAQALQRRAAFVERVAGGEWPDVSDDALVASVDEWLAPRLGAATGRADLERIDLAAEVRAHLGHHRWADLERLAPTSFALPGGRSATIDYDDDQPSISVRVQDLYGITRHPSVADGRVPIVVHLLSPAGRPVQVTADLPGFWAGSWAEVRKEMAGRYPKHDWPVDPAVSRGRTAR